MTVFAAIDVGSNAMRLAIAELDSKGKMVELVTKRESVRLGTEVFGGGRVSAETAERVVEAFDRFKTLISQFGATIVRAVGTSALREARNGRELVASVQQATGIEIEIISGEEEASLIYRAVASRVSLRGKIALLVDIGGGSVEVTVADDETVLATDTAKMGTVRLLQLLERPGQSKDRFHRLLEEYCKRVRRRLKRELNGRSIDIVVGTGGNVEAFGSLRKSYLGKGDENEVKTDELEQMLAHIEALSLEKRVEDLGLKPDRADVIVPAGVVLTNILREADARKLVVARVGVREGILLELAEGLEPNDRAGRRRQVLSSARELGRRYDVDRERAELMSDLCRRVFEVFSPAHQLADSYRLLAEIAGLVHEIGQYINMSGYHKHSAYLVRASPFVGLSKGEKEVLSLLVRYHRKSYPKAEHVEYGALKEGERKHLDKLICILRIADALITDGKCRVTGMSIDIRKSGIVLKLDGSDDLLMERWMLSQLNGFFTATYGAPLEIAEN